MGATSQNGYTANDESLIQTWTIPGTTRRVRLRRGAAGALLVDFAAWFHAHIEPLDTGQLDDWGFAVRPIRGQGVEYDDDGNAVNLSNHASGTAIDLNATRHPLGKRGTYTTAQYAAIRAKLKTYDGCIRAGLDYVKRADEMHFEIVRSPAACANVLSRLTPSHQEEDEMTDAQMQEIKAFIEANNQKYAKACNNYTRQILSSTAKALLAADAATDQAQADRIIAALDKEAAEIEAKIMPAPAQDTAP